MVLGRFELHDGLHRHGVTLVEKLSAFSSNAKQGREELGRLHGGRPVFLLSKPTANREERAEADTCIEMGKVTGRFAT